MTFLAQVACRGGVFYWGSGIEVGDVGSFFFGELFLYCEFAVFFISFVFVIKEVTLGH